MKLIVIGVMIGFLLVVLVGCASAPVRPPRFTTEREVIEITRGWAWILVKGNHPDEWIILFDDMSTPVSLDAFILLRDGRIMEFWILENGGFVLAYANGEEQKI